MFPIKDEREYPDSFGKVLEFCLRHIWGEFLFCHPHIRSAQAFKPSRYFKFHTRALFQGVEILSVQSGAVEEELLPIFCTYETATPKPDEALYLPFQTYHLLLKGGSNL
jgi:hypothetical protein